MNKRFLFGTSSQQPGHSSARAVPSHRAHIRGLTRIEVRPYLFDNLEFVLFFYALNVELSVFLLQETDPEPFVFYKMNDRT